MEHLTPELLARLHSAIRSLTSMATPTEGRAGGGAASPPVEEESVEIAGRRIRRGNRVRLVPDGHADAQDMHLIGRIATVRAVLRGVDGRQYLAVTLDDDPDADPRLAPGRYRYFDPEEVEPLPDSGPDSERDRGVASRDDRATIIGARASDESAG